MDTLGASVLSVVHVAVPSSEVEMYGKYIGRSEQCVHCRDTSLEFPSSEVPLQSINQGL